MSDRYLALLAILLLLVGAGCRQGTELAAGERAMGSPDGDVAIAIFGGGCFWCTEAVYQEVDGVLSVESGYAGGAVENPTYQQIGSGTTGHAEVVRIRYDPAKVAYATLLEIFFKTHDPTTLNRQGADVGTQYRSVIFAETDVQREEAERIKVALDASGAWSNPIVTEIAPAARFWPAEDYHQDYFLANPQAGYCRMVIAPKMAKFRKAFAEHLK